MEVPWLYRTELFTVVEVNGEHKLYEGGVPFDEGDDDTDFYVMRVMHWSSDRLCLFLEPVQGTEQKTVTLLMKLARMSGGIANTRRWWLILDDKSYTMFKLHVGSWF